MQLDIIHPSIAEDDNSYSENNHNIHFHESIFSNLSALEDHPIWFARAPNDPNSSKRLKRTSSYNFADLNNSLSATTMLPRSNSLVSLTSSNGPHLRSHIKNITDCYALSNEPSVSEDGYYEEDAVFVENSRNCNGTKLVQLLLACAEAVACRDKSHASFLLSKLRGCALVFGSPFQRVASCFVQGLTDRLNMIQPLGTVGSSAMEPRLIPFGSWENHAEALSLAYEICPYIQFGHFVANSAIMEALEGENSDNPTIHVVDLGMSLALPRGHQWRDLIGSLAKLAGPPPTVRITAVGLKVDEYLKIGMELEAYALGLGVNFEFAAVKSNLENLEPVDVRAVAGETLVVNSVLQLHCGVKESRGALNSVLKTIRRLDPKVVVLVEQDSNHNGPFFMGRFVEALHYYSAIFDALDTMLPRYDTRRAKIEQFYFADEIKNIVSCEGPARVERHEKVDQWRRRMSRAGFQPVPIKALDKAKEWLKKVEAWDGYTAVEEKGCLGLGWQNKSIVSASCWKR